MGGGCILCRADNMLAHCAYKHIYYTKKTVAVKHVSVLKNVFGMKQKNLYVNNALVAILFGCENIVALNRAFVCF